MTTELFFSGTVLAIISIVNNIYVASKGESVGYGRRLAGHLEWLLSMFLFYLAVPFPNEPAWMGLFVAAVVLVYAAIVLSTREIATRYEGLDYPVAN